MAIYQSNSLTFVDQTDSRKLEAYIQSNFPTVQIFNKNTGGYTPDWSAGLNLETDVYLDSKEITDLNGVTFKWYKNEIVNGAEVSSTNSLKIQTNELSTSPIVTYICVVSYQNISVTGRITFSRTDTGADGKDGTSVTILGSYDTLSALQSAHPTGNAGDAYLVDGRLYVWTATGKKWEDVGNIQGPKGDSGVSIKSTTITYGVSDASSTQPTSWQTNIPTVAEGEYLWTRTVIDYTDESIPDTVTYLYTKQGSKGDSGTAGSSVTVSSVQYQEGSFATTSPTGTWSNTIVPVAEGKYLWTKTTFSDGKTMYGVAKQGVSGKDGMGISSTTVDYGVSNSASTQPTTWQPSIPQAAEGQYLWTRTVIDYTDTSKADTVTYTYAKQGMKGDAGIAGTSVTVSSIQYQEGSSATTAPTGTWSPIVVGVAEGKYLWTKTTFSDGKIAYGVAKQGEKGDQGVQGPKGNDGQQYYTWIKYADTPTSGMSNDPTGKTYIGLAYNKTTATESNTYSDYMWSLIKGETGPAGPKGNDGQQYYTWVKYADNASGANMSDSPNGKSYIGLAYNKTTSAESTTASDYAWSLFKGSDGDAGEDAVTFRVYSSNGYALSINTPTLMLQTFAYAGDVAITAGATYQWYSYVDGTWTAISDGTNTYLSVTRDNVSFSNNYMCKMTFNGVEYVDVVTIEDKSDNNQVFVSKPSNYSIGDIWIVSDDYVPAKMAIGTLLKATNANTLYADSDWITATAYDSRMAKLEADVAKYNQCFSFDTTSGLRISAEDDDGNLSQFSATLSNTRLSFNQGDEAVAYIESNKMKIKEAEIESPLSVTGKKSGSTVLQYPVINIGSFSLVVESNGSLSIIANT